MTETAARFTLGRLVVTPDALAASAGGTEFAGLLRRHVAGDWGEVGEADARLNEALTSRLSAYTLQSGVKVWIVTEADHSVTTILLPEEY